MRHLDLTDSEEECGDNALGRVRRALDEMAPGDLVEIVSEVAEHAFAVRAWGRRAGAAIVEETCEDTRTRIVLRRQAA